MIQKLGISVCGPGGVDYTPLLSAQSNNVVVSVFNASSVGEIKEDRCAAAVHKKIVSEPLQLSQSHDRDQKCATDVMSTSADSAVIICRVCQGFGHKSFQCPTNKKVDLSSSKGGRGHQGANKKKFRSRVFVNSGKQYASAPALNFSNNDLPLSSKTSSERPVIALYSDVVSGSGFRKSNSSDDYGSCHMPSKPNVSGGEYSARVRTKMKVPR
jgi:hypothetical protein